MERIESQQQWEDVINSNRKSVLLFSAKWCKDCVYIEPFMPDVEEKFNHMDFYYVDRDLWIDQCIEMGIMGIPSFVVFESGKEISRFVSKDRKTQDEIETFLRDI